MSVAGTHKKMGLRGCTEAELAFDGVRVEPGDVLVPGDPADNSGLKTLLATSTTNGAATRRCASARPRARSSTPWRYMHDRKVGTELLSELQGLQWKIADIATELEGARFLLQRALVLAGRHGTPPPLESAMAKIAATWQPSASATRPSSSSAATATAGSTRSSAPTATSAACASGPARSRSSATSWEPPCSGARPAGPVVEGAGAMSTGSTKPVAILGLGAAAPSLRLAAADVGAAWGSGGGRGTVAVCDAGRGHPYPGMAGRHGRARGRRGGTARGVGPVVGYGPTSLRRGPQPRVPRHHARPRHRRGWWAVQRIAARGDGGDHRRLGRAGGGTRGRSPSS